VTAWVWRGESVVQAARFPSVDLRPMREEGGCREGLTAPPIDGIEEARVNPMRRCFRHTLTEIHAPNRAAARRAR